MKSIFLAAALFAVCGPIHAGVTPEQAEILRNQVSNLIDTSSRLSRFAQIAKDEFKYETCTMSSFDEQVCTQSTYTAQQKAARLARAKELSASMKAQAIALDAWVQAQ